jgi:hypothetical protein
MHQYYHVEQLKPSHLQQTPEITNLPDCSLTDTTSSTIRSSDYGLTLKHCVLVSVSIHENMYKKPYNEEL